ncbi:MAG TPA: hypothetical protein VG387_20095 [Rhizomicrobium sp.]|jgi:hypothetical protein|nr:hypothetical protein [Rhizomicrobium sp.]
MRVSRRKLVELAAAGAIFPAAARAQGDAPTQIVVDLGDISLPKPIAQKLELDIRRAVLQALVAYAPRTKFKALPLPRGTRGIIVRRA